MLDGPSLSSPVPSTPDEPDQLEFTNMPGSAAVSSTDATALPWTTATPLKVAVDAWTAHLAGQRHSPHTRAAYTRDLARFAATSGATTLGAIDRADVAAFLADAASRATRKRRLTSLRRFYDWLVVDQEAPLTDPTDGFVSQPVTLRVPTPLSANEQHAMLTAAASDRPWCASAIWLMLRLGLTRSEILGLRVEHIDLASPPDGGINVVADDAANRHRERRLPLDADGVAILRDHLAVSEPRDHLYPVGFQAINGMVARVARNAGIARRVTPHSLRETFAIEQAGAGADESDLIDVLGLADDSRNRESMARYIDAAGQAST